MIHLLCGNGRSGKSHSATEYYLIPYLKAGRTIVTNIPLRLPDGSEWDGSSDKPLLLHDYPDGQIIFFNKMDPISSVPGSDEFDQSFFMDFDRFPKGSVFVIDECWRYWPAGLRQDKLSIKNKEFFKEHGHRAGSDGFTTEIVLITQSHKDLATFVLSLVDKTFYTTKLDMLGAKGSYHLDIHQKVPKSETQKGYKTQKGTYKESVYKYYISHTDSDAEDSTGREEIQGDRSSFLKQFIVKISLLLILLVVAFIFVKDIFSVDEEVSNVEVTVSDDGNSVHSENKTEKKRTAELEDFAIPGQGIVYITGYLKTPSLIHFFKTSTGYTFTSDQLRSMGYRLQVKSLCIVTVTDYNDLQMVARCGQGALSKEGK